LPAQGWRGTFPEGVLLNERSGLAAASPSRSGHSWPILPRQLTAAYPLYISRRSMTIDFTCQKCEASFEIDAQDLIDGTEKIVCPECRARAPSSAAEDFVSALTEMRAQVAVMAKKFAVNMGLETEDVEEELESKKDDEDEDEERELDFEDDDLEDEDDESLEDEDMNKR
jgi:DNA-directed RNA polymerase subunit RPC12/RpoP